MITSIKNELTKRLLNQTITAENARKARKRQFNRVLQIEEVLYAKEARFITTNKLKKKRK